MNPRTGINVEIILVMLDQLYTELRELVSSEQNRKPYDLLEQARKVLVNFVGQRDYVLQNENYEVAVLNHLKSISEFYYDEMIKAESSSSKDEKEIHLGLARMFRILSKIEKELVITDWF